MALSSGSLCLIQSERWAYCYKSSSETNGKISRAVPACFRKAGRNWTYYYLWLVLLQSFNHRELNLLTAWLLLLRPAGCTPPPPQPAGATRTALPARGNAHPPEGLRLCSLLRCYPLHVPAQPAASLRLGSEAGPTFPPPHCWREPTDLGAFRYSSNKCSLRHREFLKVPEDIRAPVKPTLSLCTYFESLRFYGL